MKAYFVLIIDSHSKGTINENSRHAVSGVAEYPAPWEKMNCIPTNKTEEF